MIYIGIDPGREGAIAVLKGTKVLVETMPSRLKDIWDYLDNSIDDEQEIIAFIERVGGYISGNPTPGSMMFKFGRNYGALLMAMTGLEIHYREVPPYVWQSGLGIPSRGKEEPPYRFKTRLKDFAQSIFTDIDVTLSNADALLIAHFGRKTTPVIPGEPQYKPTYRPSPRSVNNPYYQPMDETEEPEDPDDS